MSRLRPLPWLLLLGLACEAGAAPAPTPPPAPVVAPPPASAPAPAPTPTASKTRLRQTAGVDHLEFIHVAPGTPKADAPTADAVLPLIIALHGRGDDPEGFEHLLDGLPVHARVIVPRAFDPLGDDGFSWFPIRARSADVAALARGIDGANDRLAVMIAELLKTRPTRGKALVTGFSQGGMLSFAMAVLYPDEIGASLPVAGWLPPQLTPRRVLDATAFPPIHALHGTGDPVVRLAPTRRSVRRMRQLGLDVALDEIVATRHSWTPELREAHRRLMRDAVSRALEDGVTSPGAAPAPSAPGT